MKHITGIKTDWLIGSDVFSSVGVFTADMSHHSQGENP